MRHATFDPREDAMTAGFGWDAPDIVLVGGGNMGGALAGGYLARMPHARVLVVDPNVEQVRKRLPQDGRVAVVPTIGDLCTARPGLTILAVKPQSMSDVLRQFAPTAASCGLVVSIAAGFSTAAIARGLPRARIVRAMPNTPAIVGFGATGLWGDASVSSADRALCEALFNSVGLTRWLAHEQEIDAVTAVSGSGPAYVFAFVEALAQAGVRAGLDETLAAELARATLIGAAVMLQDIANDPSQLKAAVRSPGGTTDAALRTFEEAGDLVALIARAVAAAHTRARELSQIMD